MSTLTLENCTRCDGCGRIADCETGEPWTAWQDLPPGGDLAVRAGIVKPIPCPDCSGSGRCPKLLARLHQQDLAIERQKELLESTLAQSESHRRLAEKLSAQVRGDLSLNAYQQEALRTAPRDPKAYPAWMDAIPDGEIREAARRDWDRLIWALGLAGEAGEVADYIKKCFGHGHQVDRARIAKELGDVDWYRNVLADAFGFTAEEVAKLNVAKLRERYPEGFTVAASQARKDEAR